MIIWIRGFTLKKKENANSKDLLVSELMNRKTHLELDGVDLLNILNIKMILMGSNIVL